MSTSNNKSIRFFDDQFKRQIQSGDFVLNPFERAVLPFVFGDVVDLGCGLGNLSIAAANQSKSVLALDASESAVQALGHRAAQDHLPITAQAADLASYDLNGKYDTVLCIGLLMFFRPDVASSWIERIRSATKQNGIVAINVLIEGTTYLDMFEPGNFTLLPEDGLRAAFGGWKIEYESVDQFDAPGGTKKRFSTIVARKV